MLWTDVCRLPSLVTFLTNPKYFLLFMPSYGLPLLSSASPISSPSLMHPLSQGISSGVRFRSCGERMRLFPPPSPLPPPLPTSAADSVFSWSLRCRNDVITQEFTLPLRIKCPLLLKNQRNRREMLMTAQLWMQGTGCFDF